MTTPPDHEARLDFDYFSREYAQAQQALTAIEGNAPTLIALGSTANLRQFVATFIEMADRTQRLAETQNEENFAGWFGELIERAKAIAAAADGA